MCFHIFAMRLFARIYAYLYEIAISLFLIALALVAISTDVRQLRLPMLPWEGSMLARALLILGILGVASVLLAVTGRFRPALPVWALVVLVLMFRGWFASSYTFSSASAFYGALWVTIGALLALICSVFVLLKRNNPR